MSKTKHTPTPWKVYEFGGVQIGQAETADAICSMWGDADEGKANAAVIVRAVNHHDKLVDALESLLSAGVEMPEYGPVLKARAALASLDQESGQ